jgi:hypothetical protein
MKEEEKKNMSEEESDLLIMKEARINNITDFIKMGETFVYNVTYSNKYPDLVRDYIN